MTLIISEDLLQRLVSIRVNPCKGSSENWICVERRDSKKGTRWAVTRGGRSCWNKLGEWEFEPMPSSRDDEFFNRCRYDTFEEAWAAAEACSLNGG